VCLQAQQHQTTNSLARAIDILPVGHHCCLVVVSLEVLEKRRRHSEFVGAVVVHEEILGMKVSRA